MRQFCIHPTRPALIDSLGDPRQVTRPMSPGNPRSAERLSTKRLLSTRGAMRRRPTPDADSAARDALLDRLAAYRDLAETLGWTGFALERERRGGRLCLRGIRSVDHEREGASDCCGQGSHAPARRVRARFSDALPRKLTDHVDGPEELK
jgi:hypothetical protein